MRRVSRRLMRSLSLLGTADPAGRSPNVRASPDAAHPPCHATREAPEMDQEKLKSLFDVRDRVAIVTGGTRGIGRAVAEGLVCAGANVVVASRKREACAEAEQHLNSLGGGAALGVPTHMGELDALSNLTAAIVERFGGIDIR